MTPEELFDDWLEGALHRGEQIDARGVLLTVQEILAPFSRGKVEAGEAETTTSLARPVEPLGAGPGDPFGQWRLREGIYQVRFRETLKEGAAPVLLVSHERLLAAGCALAPTVAAPGPISTVLTVPKNGTNIRRNARIALLCPFQ